MTMLEKIQADAVDPAADLSALLRRCKLLGARLGVSRLEEWLLWESNGYPVDVEVPSYRQISLDLRGDFSGGFGMWLKNVPIPSMALPVEIRKSLGGMHIRQSIASIEDTLRGNTGGHLRVNLDNLAVAIGTSMFNGYGCVSAWGIVNRAHLMEILNSVRNRVLDFAVALWKEDPNAGEIGQGENEVRIAPERANQIFNTINVGGSFSLIGQAQDSPVNVTFGSHDFPALAAELKKVGVSSEDAKDLQAALEAEPLLPEKRKFGPKVAGWIGEMVKKAASGTWAVGLETAGNLLAGLIMKYYGVN